MGNEFDTFVGIEGRIVIPPDQRGGRLARISHLRIECASTSHQPPADALDVRVEHVRDVTSIQPQPKDAIARAIDRLRCHAPRCIQASRHRRSHLASEAAPAIARSRARDSASRTIGRRSSRSASQRQPVGDGICFHWLAAPVATRPATRAHRRQPHWTSVSSKSVAEVDR